MGWACGCVWVRRGGCIGSSWGNRRERNRWGDPDPDPDQTALGPNQPPVKWVPCLSLR